MQRWQCPIHNNTLETVIWSIWSIMGKILLFFLIWKISDNSCSVKCANYFCRETTIKNLNLIIILNWSNKTLKGITIVNWALPYLYGRSLEITLTAPLKFEGNFTNSRKIPRWNSFFLIPFAFQPDWNLEFLKFWSKIPV